MTLSLDPVLPSSTLDVVEIGTGSRTLRPAWASVKDLQLLAQELPPSLLHQEDLVPRFHPLAIYSARTMMAIHPMKNQTVRQTALLPKHDATGLDASMELRGTTMTAPVAKSATALSHAKDLSVPQEPPARWDFFVCDNFANFDGHFRRSRIRLVGRLCTKQFVKTTPRRGFVLKWTGTNMPTVMLSATQVF